MASTDVPGSSPRRTRGRHLIGPLLLLVAGVLLLLNNLQIVPWSIWREIWPFWPLLLVLLGLEALVTGRVAWGTLALLVLLLPILGFVVTASSFASRWHDETRGDVGRRTSMFHQGLDGASSATIQVEYGAGALDIGPLAGPPPANTLALGEVFGHGGTRFEAQSTLQNGRRILQVSPSHAGTMFDLGRLELRLTSAIPIDIEIESGASELTLNLETLRIPNLSIETGASQTRIVLPAQGETKVQIEGGAAGIEIVVPPNVAARIMVEEGPNRVQIDEQRFPRRGDEYRSPNFDTATDRATLRIDVGASRLVVQ